MLPTSSSIGGKTAGQFAQNRFGAIIRNDHSGGEAIPRRETIPQFPFLQPQCIHARGAFPVPASSFFLSF